MRKPLIRRLASFVVMALLGAAILPAQTPVLQVTPLVPGCPGQLTLTGEAYAAFLIAADSGPGPVAVPTLGLVELDLGPGFFILVDGAAFGVTLDAAGSFVIDIVLPPAFPPMTVWLQAAVVGSGPIQLSNGAAAIVQAPPPPSFSPSAGAIPAESSLAEDGLFGDFDGDGDLDLAVANSGVASPGTAAVQFLVNQGGLQQGTEGTFLDETAARLGANAVTALCLAAADVDGDFDLDLFLGRDDFPALNLPNLLLINQGGVQGGLPGHFTADATFGGGAWETQAATFADVDGDGDQDLVLGNGTDVSSLPQPNELFVNVGGTFYLDTLHFGSAPWNTPGETDDVVAADLTGDGSVDLVLVRDGVDLLLINSSLGTFTPATGALPAIANNSTAGAAADFDLDGDLDLFIGNIGQPDALLLNDGTGTFTPATLPLPPTAPIHLDAAVADLDRDGDPDVVVAVHALGGGETSFLYLNQGGAQGGTPGTFQASLLAGAPSEVIMAVVTGDVDSDGDDDVFLASQGFFGPTAQDVLLTTTFCP